MTEPVVCHDGRCRYKQKREDADESIEDDLLQQIETALLKDNLAM